MKEPSAARQVLSGERVAFLGKLAGMPKREAQQLVRAQGGVAPDRLDDTTTLLVVGEAGLAIDEIIADSGLADFIRRQGDTGRLHVLGESQLWQRLGLIEVEQNVHRLYTAAMLASLVGAPLSQIRRWHRRGLIKPVREVRRLAYFDFEEVATASRLAELIAGGAKPADIERQLAMLARFVPEVERPLAQLSVLVQGKELLVWREKGLAEPNGQLRFDFSEVESDEPSETLPMDRGPRLAAVHLPLSPAEMLALAGELEDDDQLDHAADMYRAALAAGGPTAEICFRLAELLYQLNDLSAARERYYMAVELDEHYVEARANLGCVLMELGDRELAVSAFEGALLHHGEYPDVHFHLARLLNELGRGGEAREHWLTFIELCPDSPWAEEARERLGLQGQVDLSEH